MADKTIIVDPRQIVEINTTPRVIEASGKTVEVNTFESRIIETTRALKYVSNKITFVVGSTSTTPISAGNKHVYGTRFGDGVITDWSVISDATTILTASVLRASTVSFPTFTEILPISLAGTRATGTASIPVADLDVLNLEILSNVASTRITVELFIR